MKTEINNKLDRLDKSFNKFKDLLKSDNTKFKKIDIWLEKESNIFTKEAFKDNLNNLYPRFKRGQIIKVDFGINIGAELSHTHFAIVLNKDDTMHNDNITVVPITSKKGYKRIYLGKVLELAMPNTLKYNLECYALITQLKTISKKRVFSTKIKYVCDVNILQCIDKAIVKNLTNINLEYLEML